MVPWVAVTVVQAYILCNRMFSSVLGRAAHQMPVVCLLSCDNQECLLPDVPPRTKSPESRKTSGLRCFS